MWAMYCPVNCWPHDWRKIQIRDTFRFSWHLLDLSYKPCRLIPCNPYLNPNPSIDHHKYWTTFDSFSSAIIWDYIFAPSDTYQLLETDQVSKMYLKRLKTMESAHNNSHIYCNRQPPKPFRLSLIVLLFLTYDVRAENSQVTYPWEFGKMEFLCKTSIDIYLINKCFITIYSTYSSMYSLQYRCATFYKCGPQCMWSPWQI